jgi:uracil-DNA glycosylase
VRLALVGEAPGADEVALGVPFSGKSGWWLNQWLAQAGLSRYSCFVGNVCVEENTPVLMADLTWKPINKIAIGDRLLAFDERGKTRGVSSDWRRWQVSTVLGVKHSMRDCIHFASEHGNLTMTPDHRFLSYHSKGQVGKWVQAGHVRKGTRFSYTFSPEAVDFCEYDRAYLAGLFDGEGSLVVSSALKGKRSLSVSFAQVDNIVMQEGLAAIKRLGFDVQISAVGRRKANQKTGYRIRIKGGVRETLRFLSLVRPHRLLPKLANFLTNPPVFRSRGSRILQKFYIGPQRVVDIQTTTHTFIANGFAVHNCQMRPSPTSNEFDLLEWNGPRVQEGIAALARDLEAFRPNCIVALGNAAFHLFRHGNVAPTKSAKLGLFQWPSRVGTWRGSLFEAARSFDGVEAQTLRERGGRRTQLFYRGVAELDASRAISMGRSMRTVQVNSDPAPATNLTCPPSPHEGAPTTPLQDAGGARPDSARQGALPDRAGPPPFIFNAKTFTREELREIVNREGLERLGWLGWPVEEIRNALREGTAKEGASHARITQANVGDVTAPTLPPSYKCLCTYHPAATFRDPSFTYPLVSDLKRAVAEAATPTLVLPVRNILWNLTVQEVEMACEGIHIRRTPVGFDIEGGLGGLQCCSFATSPREAFVIDLMERDLDYSRKMAAIAAVLEDPRVPKVLWNAMYERSILQAVASITMRNYEDGMLAWWERFSELPKALDFVASILTREPYWAEGIGWDRKTGAPKVIGPPFYLYNGIDSCVTLEIWEHPLIRAVAESRTPVPFAL